MHVVSWFEFAFADDTYSFDVLLGKTSNIPSNVRMSVILHSDKTRNAQSGKLFFVGGKWAPGSSCDYTVATSKRLGHIAKITLELENASPEVDVVLDEVCATLSVDDSFNFHF